MENCCRIATRMNSDIFACFILLRIGSSVFVVVVLFYWTRSEIENKIGIRYICISQRFFQCVSCVCMWFLYAFAAFSYGLYTHRISISFTRIPHNEWLRYSLVCALCTLFVSCKRMFGSECEWKLFHPHCGWNCVFGGNRNLLGKIDCFGSFGWKLCRQLRFKSVANRTRAKRIPFNVL